MENMTWSDKKKAVERFPVKEQSYPTAKLLDGSK